MTSTKISLAIIAGLLFSLTTGCGVRGFKREGATYLMFSVELTECENELTPKWQSCTGAMCATMKEEYENRRNQCMLTKGWQLTREEGAFFRSTSKRLWYTNVKLFMGTLNRASTITEDQINKCWVREPTWIGNGIAYRRNDQQRVTVFEVRRTTKFSKEIKPFLYIRILDGGDPKVPPGGNQVLSITVAETDFAPDRVLNLSEDVWMWTEGKRDCQNQLQ